MKKLLLILLCGLILTSCQLTTEVLPVDDRTGSQAKQGETLTSSGGCDLACQQAASNKAQQEAPKPPQQ